ncbi:MAG: hypothetical protein ABI230_12300 [Aestuariivirga sp.]
MMSRLGIVVLIGASLICPPVLADEAALNKRIDDLETRIKALELIVPFIRAAGEHNTAGAGNPGQAEGKVDLAKDAPPLTVHLDSIKASGKDILGKPTIAIKVTVVNPTDKDIGIMNASISIEDKAGNRLANLKWEHNQGIGPGKTVTQSGQYSDDYNGWVETIMTTDPSMISASIKVYKIAFRNGTVETYAECGFNC